MSIVLEVPDLVVLQETIKSNDTDNKIIFFMINVEFVNNGRNIGLPPKRFLRLTLIAETIYWEEENEGIHTMDFSYVIFVTE